MVTSEVLHDFTVAQLKSFQNDIEVAGSFEDLSRIAARMTLEIRWPQGFAFLCEMMKHCRTRTDEASFQQIAQNLMDLIEQHMIPKSSEVCCGVLPKTYTKFVKQD